MAMRKTVPLSCTWIDRAVSPCSWCANARGNRSTCCWVSVTRWAKYSSRVAVGPAKCAERAASCGVACCGAVGTPLGLGRLIAAWFAFGGTGFGLGRGGDAVVVAVGVSLGVG